ncbi:hypothetical protein OPT61_g5261 [Boeremia exigua]|uniref:Uncharacterized protein n=1 Tax=Boeremia exigua TaxID=749465 RepID=A0ACC2IB50_9PLEO|nr:hypothetical protein OPT61_g5261 [Boeremia exigua]
MRFSTAVGLPQHLRVLQAAVDSAVDLVDFPGWLGVVVYIHLARSCCRAVLVGPRQLCPMGGRRTSQSCPTDVNNNKAINRPRHRGNKALAYQQECTVSASAACCATQRAYGTSTQRETRALQERTVNLHLWFKPLPMLIVQLGGVGTELSKALYLFLRSVCKADDDISALANDIGQTCTALDSVRSVLVCAPKDLISSGAVLQAEHIVASCKAIFADISAILDKGRKIQPGGTKRATFWAKCSWPLKEKEVRDLSRRLQSLKISLLLLLNVIQLAQGEAREQLASELQTKSDTIRVLWARLKSLEAQDNDQEPVNGQASTPLSAPTSTPLLVAAALPTARAYQPPHVAVSGPRMNQSPPLVLNGSADNVRADADEHLDLAELSKWAAHVQSLLQHVTDLQEELAHGIYTESCRSSQMHTVFQRYRREFAADIASRDAYPPLAAPQYAGQPLVLSSRVGDVEMAGQSTDPTAHAFREGAMDSVFAGDDHGGGEMHWPLATVEDSISTPHNNPAETHKMDLDESFSGQIQGHLRYVTPPLPQSPKRNHWGSRRQGHRRSTRGDWELIKEMDPTRPDLATAIAQEPLRDHSGTESSNEEPLSDHPSRSHTPAVNLRSGSLADANPCFVERRESHASSTGSVLQSVSSAISTSGDHITPSVSKKRPNPDSTSQPQTKRLRHANATNQPNIQRSDSVGELKAARTPDDKIFYRYLSLGLEATPPLPSVFSGFDGLDALLRSEAVRSNGEDEDIVSILLEKWTVPNVVGYGMDYVLGRVFLQEIYIIVDYERMNFSISQAVADKSDIVPIYNTTYKPSPEGSPPAQSKIPGSGYLSAGAYAGIAIGILSALALIVLLIVAKKSGWWVFRKKSLEQDRFDKAELNDSAKPRVEAMEKERAELPVNEHRLEIAGSHPPPEIEGIHGVHELHSETRVG